IDTGRREILIPRFLPRTGSEWNFPLVSLPMLRVCRVFQAFCFIVDSSGTRVSRSGESGRWERQWPCSGAGRPRGGSVVFGQQLGRAGFGGAGLGDQLIGILAIVGELLSFFGVEQY